ncbi:hypothetical protein A3842_12125 [Paenibacillus sp. P3E]|uniref:hypothetical protein n=1 Tax=unclassified Paenibacillus TaxID=185978 RepID=UPI00093BADDD|nr:MULTISPECIES: hypothetical protein [unclassified Paenibacillus]OKP80012.1 hypothetical protein A3842_12125 [Paenibacillus sp. P3E]OKP82543.1 hypothetical protein A3848_28375 [Paenibacillus sp. P32E]
MSRRLLVRAAVCLLVLMGMAGCAVRDEAPGVVELHRMSDLEGPLNPADNRLSPVLEDVYSRSIPEDVYSTQ